MSDDFLLQKTDEVFELIDARFVVNSRYGTNYYALEFDIRVINNHYNYKPLMLDIQCD